MAVWLARLAVVSACAAAAAGTLAGVGTRVGWWHFRTGFQLLTWAAYGGAASVVLAFLEGVVARGRRGAIVPAVLAIVLGGVTAGIPWHMKRTAQQVPAIHDITTDVHDPPRFVALAAARKDAPNSLEYGGADVAAQQAAAYPDIKPAALPMPVDQAFALAANAARAMGWDIVSIDPGAGLIEATDTTFWFGFKDDVAIRVRPSGNHAIVDIRSVSRVGKSDVGANARRIRAYLQTLRDTAASNQ